MSKKIIEAELKKGVENIIKAADSDAVQSVKLLLDADRSKDRALLKGLGMDHHVVQAENAKGAKIELESLEDQFKGEVYHLNDIKRIALNYRLRFLPSKYYSGAVDVEMLAKIKEFEKLVGGELNEAQLEYRFFILAPASAFNLEHIKVPAKPKDPVLFYKLDDKHFKMLHKWGSDFSILRAIVGWRWKNIATFRWSSVFISMALTSLIHFLLPVSFIIEHPALKTLVYMALAVALYFVVFNQNYTPKGERWLDENLSENNWESPRTYH